jgi:hypothetical protein
LRSARAGPFGIEGVEPPGDVGTSTIEQGAVGPLDHQYGRTHQPGKLEHAHARRERVRGERRPQVNQLPPRLDTRLLFPSKGGKPMILDNFRRRDWAPAIDAALTAAPFAPLRKRRRRGTLRRSGAAPRPQNQHGNVSWGSSASAL